MSEKKLFFNRKGAQNKDTSMETNETVSKPPKEKKVRVSKPPKEKKVKTPKPPRAKKVKTPKPPKEKRVKTPRVKKAKTPKPVSFNSGGKVKKFINKVWMYIKKFGKLLKKLAAFLLDLLPKKKAKDAPLLDGNVKVKPQFCIQTKLIGCFIIPVLLIIILGVVSYTRASNALVNNYEGAVKQSISMTKEYFDFVLTNIESDMNVYLSDQSLGDYFIGIYDSTEEEEKTIQKLKEKSDKTAKALAAQTPGTLDYYKAYKANIEAEDEYETANQQSNDKSAEENDLYKSYNSQLGSKIAANNFISNIYIFKEGKDMITTQMSLRRTGDSDSETNQKRKKELEEKQFYKSFTNTAFGKAVVEDQMNYHWNGPQPELDKVFETDGSKYILRVAHALTSTSDGLIIVDLRRDTINDILQRLNLGEGSYIGIISPDGQELITKGKALDATNAEEAEETTEEEEITETIYSDKDFYKEAVESEEETGSSYVRYNGSSYLFVYAKLGSSKMMLCSLIPNSVIVADANSIKWFTIVVVLFASFIAMLVGTLISRGFSKSINATIKQLEKVSRGDLTVEFRTNRRDEFALLYGSCNDMLFNIRGLLLEVNQVYDTLTASLNKVEYTSSTFSKTTQDIQTSIHEVETGITQQSDDASECLNQMDALFNKINVVNENTDEIGSIASVTKTAIGSGLSSIENLNEKTGSTTEITQSIINTINKLAEHSKSIGNIVNTINNIAEETNLLSLNASIEAARAGNAGRGFAVVAGEIRKLADECLASSNKISGIIEEITQTTQTATLTAREAEDIVREQVAAVRTTAASFEEMNEHVGNLADYLIEIQSSSKDMEESGSNTLKSMESISSILQETSASISSLTTTADMQTDALGGLNDASSQMVEHSSHLGSAISKFKVN